MSKIPWNKVAWTNCLFLGSMILTVAVAVPVYIWKQGLDGFQIGLFLAFFVLTGISITLGYHRLFAHRAFKASWPVRLFTLIFGAAAFENSALNWASDHRRHHKHVDHDGDPYDFTKGFFHAHIGWILMKDPLQKDLPYVRDLLQDRLVMWQHRRYLWIALAAGLGLPALLGWFWNGMPGALGGFLIGGVGRGVAVQQFTFFINSLCHCLGRQPYSAECTARDSAIMAFFTFGEGYHNFHHTFQHDYRNGVKPWQFDPTKWTIWILSRLGLASDLRRVPDEKILHREIARQQVLLADQLQSKSAQLSEALRQRLQGVQLHLDNAYARWEELEKQYRQALERNLESSREKATVVKQEFRQARESLHAAFMEWRETHQMVMGCLVAA